MPDRSLPGVLLIALVASSVLYLAFSGGGAERLSILEIRVPERMYYSDEEYHVIISVVARSDISEVDLRLHWLRGVDRETLLEARADLGVFTAGDAREALESVEFFDQLLAFTSDTGVEPTIHDIWAEVNGMIQRIIFLSIGPAQELFLPDRIGQGEGRRPQVLGSYAMMINSTGHLANLFTGYPAFFDDVERSLISFEVGVNREKSVYQNRTLESSLPRLRDLPIIGRLRLPLAEGDRLDVVAFIEGRSLRWWSPRLCVVEIRADGELVEIGAYPT
jgi:hypothetical protein